MLTFFTRSRYRFPIYGLLFLLLVDWALWFATGQISGPEPLLYVTGVLLLNIVLAYFATTRIPYLAYFFFSFSYAIALLVAYMIITFARGVL
jgi:hypothetical protein